MMISHKNLIGLPVETKSGLLLGKIINFDIDSETQAISEYLVKSRSLIGKLLSRNVAALIIRPNQVISISQEKMVVEDLIVKEDARARLLQGVGQELPALSSDLMILDSRSK